MPVRWWTTLILTLSDRVYYNSVFSIQYSASSSFRQIVHLARPCPSLSPLAFFTPIFTAAKLSVVRTHVVVQADEAVIQQRIVRGVTSRRPLVEAFCHARLVLADGGFSRPQWPQWIRLRDAASTRGRLALKLAVPPAGWRLGDREDIRSAAAPPHPVCARQMGSATWRDRWDQPRGVLLGAHEIGAGAVAQAQAQAQAQ